jgi:hypothetical protein
VITFRHHVVTIISVFVALAVGVILGGGPLSELGRTEEAPAAQNAPDEAAGPTYEDAFVSAVSPALVTGRLADQQVALVTLPGADESLVQALAEQVVSAGGTLSGTYRVLEAMTDPGQKPLVDTLSSQVVAQQAAAGDAAAPTYTRTGQLLGFAIANPEAGVSEVNGKARGVREAVVGAQLLSVDGAPEARAPLVLVVLGSTPAENGGSDIMAGLMEGLASRSAGLVIAGTMADGQDGQLSQLRAAPGAALAATVDGIDVSAGRTAAILALARALSADGGSFGASGSDGPAPLG